jgi:methanethiol S-methyltransferase
MVRLFQWLGGGAFVAALGVCAWWYVVGLEVSRPYAGATPIVFDAVLFSVFALHHSIFARTGAKAAMARVLPETLLRSVYVWTASLLLVLVCVLWRGIGGTLYDATGVAAVAHAAVQLAGVLLVARAAAVIDPLELAGIRPAPRIDAPEITGPYGWVRHPIYLGWLLATFGTAHMNGDRLVFSTVAAFYLLVAIPFEERSLGEVFGARYDDYKRRVRWRVLPFVY